MKEEQTKDEIERPKDSPKPIVDIHPQPNPAAYDGPVVYGEINVSSRNPDEVQQPGKDAGAVADPRKSCCAHQAPCGLTLELSGGGAVRLNEMLGRNAKLVGPNECLLPTKFAPDRENCDDNREPDPCHEQTERRRAAERFGAAAKTTTHVRRRQ